MQELMEQIRQPKPPSREAWLAERRTGIGSSDAAAIAGLSGWRTPWEVYLDKTGQLPDVEPTPEQRWGLRHEPTIAAAYEEQQGVSLAKPYLMRHPKYPWMLATVDRITDAGRIVELKTANPHAAKDWGEPWTDQVPEQYLIQVQHQMAVVDADAADIAVLVGLSDFRVYTVRRCDQLIFDLIHLEQEFWAQVEARKPPTPDWSKVRTRDILRKLKPNRSEVLHIDDAQALLEVDDFLVNLAKEKEAKANKERAKCNKELAQAQLIYRMGQAEEALLPDGRLLTRSTIKRRGYTVKPCEYQLFKVWE